MSVRSITYSPGLHQFQAGEVYDVGVWRSSSRLTPSAKPGDDHAIGLIPGQQGVRSRFYGVWITPVRSLRGAAIRSEGDAEGDGILIVLMSSRTVPRIRGDTIIR